MGILEKIGLGNLDTGYLFIGMAVLILILIVVVIMLIVKTNRMMKRYEKFMEGKNGKTLEGEFAGLFEDVRFLKSAQEADKKDIRVINNRLKKAYVKTGLEKYDAYHESGGRLSFALCLLDEENNGLLMNSMRNSNTCYSYTKKIENGSCKLELSEPEQRALAKALGTSQETE